MCKIRLIFVFVFSLLSRNVSSVDSIDIVTLQFIEFVVFQDDNQKVFWHHPDQLARAVDHRNRIVSRLQHF